jgi:ABC-type branched-subunit amino acid transport system substrate-binding protein
MKRLTRALAAAVLAALLSGSAPAARAAEPIKIGFSMELTGPFAVVGKTGLLAFKIWEEEVNAEGPCSAARSSWSITTTRATLRWCPASIRS